MSLRVASRRRLPLEEFFRLPSFYLATPSWARDRIAFYWDRTGRIELYVMDLRTGDVRQVSHGEVPRSVRSAFAWDRTDSSIVFAKDVDGNEQHDLYRIDVEGGEVEQLTHDPSAQEHPVEFSPDNAWLTVVSNRSQPDAPDRPGQMNIWRWAADGSAYVPLTAYPFPAVGGGFSPDGSRISFVTNEDPSDLRNRDGYVMGPDGSEVRTVFTTKPGARDIFGDWHPDSRRIAVTTDSSGHNRAGVLDVESGDVRWLGSGRFEETAQRFSHNGRWLACFRNRESQVRPILYDVETEEGRELRLPEGFAFGADFVLGDAMLLVNYSTDTSRPSLLLYDLESDSSDVILPAEHGTIDPSAFVPSEHVTYTSFDGLEIPALLYAPQDIDEGERLPALVHVHGGPTGQFFRTFDVFAQFLVDSGFVVLCPNIRGSTGYGVEFRDAALMDWGGADLEDVAAGAGYLKGLGYVDSDRIVVFGGSYGGFMTFIAATKKPDLWHAAVAWVGISDLHAMYEESEEQFKYFLREQMGDPQADAELWRDRSAINFAQDLKAKLLMIHGVNDPRCPVGQSRLFRDRLLELGRSDPEDFEYVELAEEGHGSQDIDQRLRVFRVLADWLDKTL